ncbi:MAG: hypothetical protein ACP5OC_04415 [Thermoplasmata archaeon]
MLLVRQVDDPAELNLMIPVITSIWKNTSIRSELADTFRSISYNGGVVLQLLDRDEINVLLIGAPGYKQGEIYLYAKTLYIKEDLAKNASLSLLFPYLKIWALDNDYNFIFTELDPFDIDESSFFFENMCPSSAEPFLLDIANNSAMKGSNHQALRMLIGLPLDSSCDKDVPSRDDIPVLSAGAINMNPSRYVKSPAIYFQLLSGIKDLRRADPLSASAIEEDTYKAIQSLLQSGFVITDFLIDATIPVYLFKKRQRLVV